ncbi:MAG: hypothetical protein KBS78_06825 [Bacteroidales bacterium]|nr:hypothetical protein [Candidatus Cryptobacteroides faecihippi]
MKTINRITMALAALLSLVSCNDKLEIRFEDYFVCIKDEADAETSNFKASSEEDVTTLYVSLIAPPLGETLTVDYEITAGNGLVEGVDYKLLSSKKSVSIANGVTRMPIRIAFMPTPADKSKDNTLKIELKSCSMPSIKIGYPGPSKRFSTHVITKY